MILIEKMAYVCNIAASTPEIVSTRCKRDYNWRLSIHRKESYRSTEEMGMLLGIVKGRR